MAEDFEIVAEDISTAINSPEEIKTEENNQTEISEEFKTDESTESETKDEISEEIKTEEKPEEKKGRGGSRKGAGRPKKSQQKTEVKPEESNQDFETVAEDIAAQINPDQEKDFDESEYQVIEIENKEQEKRFTVHLNGMILLTAMNFIFPALTVMVLGIVAKDAKGKIKSEEIQLSKDELKQLEPAADEVATKLFSKISPEWQLIIGFATFTGTKAFFKLKSLKMENGKN